VCHEGTPEEGVLRAAMLHKGESTDAEAKAEQPVVRKRPLGIPTVADRIAQTVVKYGSKHPEKDSRR
jgi:hypothetical protein